MKTRQEQRGLTFIGWLVLLIPLAIVGYAAIRLTPVYLNYMKVVRSMEQVATDFRSDESLNPGMIRGSLEKRLDVESVNFPAPKDIAVRRDGRTWIQQAKYEDVAPLFGEISLLVAFDKTVRIE